MITLQASADYGHSGQYVARIVGRDAKYTFAREFIGRKGGKRGDCTNADVDDPGLYEMCDVTRKRGKESRYRVILADGETLRVVRADKDEAMKIARALDEGRRIDQIVADVDWEEHTFTVLTAAAAKKAAAGQTLESATAACWDILQALPQKDARKILAELKRRVNPAKPVEADTEEPGND